MASPVAGFRPFRSFFSFAQNLPKLLIRTSSPDSNVIDDIGFGDCHGVYSSINKKLSRADIRCFGVSREVFKIYPSSSLESISRTGFDKSKRT